jgi:hypothetical protein
MNFKICPFLYKMNKEIEEKEHVAKQKKLTRTVKADKAEPKKTEKTELKTDKTDSKKTEKTELKTNKAEPKKTEKTELKTDKTEPKKTNKTEPKEKIFTTHKFPLTRIPSKSLVSMYVSKEIEELLWASIRGRR